MNMTRECRRQLSMVKESAADPTMAYVARTRLRRMLLACSRTVARKYGLTKPVLPSYIQVPKGASHNFSELARCCNRLTDIANTLCQPSEPLDARWKSEWASVHVELERIDDILGYIDSRSNLGTKAD